MNEECITNKIHSYYYYYYKVKSKPTNSNENLYLCLAFCHLRPWIQQHNGATMVQLLLEVIQLFDCPTMFCFVISCYFSVDYIRLDYLDSVFLPPGRIQCSACLRCLTVTSASGVALIVNKSQQRGGHPREGKLPYIAGGEHNTSMVVKNNFILSPGVKVVLFHRMKY